MSLRVTSKSAGDTAAIAAALAPLLKAGDALLLDGELAAGKTTFVAALARALGASDVATSPTFAIAQFYAGGAFPILHMDAYRLESMAEFRDLALDDYFETALTVVEWGERVAPAFPQHLSIAFAAADDARTLTFTPVGERWRAAWADIEAALGSRERSDA